MKLLLDEHYSKEIAVQLRVAGHDVVAVGEVGLPGIGDEELLRYAVAEGRALLTNNVRHLAPLARRFAADGESHAGIVFTSDLSLPRATASIGRYGAALDEVMQAKPGEDSLRDQARWLG